MNNHLNPSWTPEEENILKTHCGLLSFPKIKELYLPHRSPVSLQKKSLKLGLSSNFRAQKHSIDENFYDTPNILNCYYAGNFAADGCIQYRGNSTSYTLNVNTQDVELLHNFKRDTKYTGDVRSYQRKKFQQEEMKDVSYLTISCVNEWREPLKNNFGIIPDKTLRMTPPTLKQDVLKWAYIIGYLDGDGSIQLRQEDKLTIDFYSSNITILSWILHELKNILLQYNILSNANMYTHENCSAIGFSYLNAAIIINHFMSLEVPKLKRKWNRENIFIKLQYYKDKYPKYFMDKKPLIETHGQVEETVTEAQTNTPPVQKFQKTLLEQVWGADSSTRYGTMDIDVYNARLQDMTRADLESHARQMGVMVVEHSHRLREKLLSEFNSYVSLARKPVSNAVAPGSAMSKEALKILSEGR